MTRILKTSKRKGQSNQLRYH